MKPIILASGSPRRIKLLKLSGYNFRVIPSRAEEKINLRFSPVQNVKRLSRAKALDVAAKVSEGIIIAADTVVALRGKILGKPKNKREATIMLSKLSGKEHKVITGITVIDAKTKGIKQTTVTTKVKFYKLSKKMINRYVATGEPLDKAGAYGIQGKGSFLVDSIKGDYFNVVGLPLNPLNQLLEKFGLNVRLDLC